MEQPLLLSDEQPREKSAEQLEREVQILHNEVLRMQDLVRVKIKQAMLSAGVPLHHLEREIEAYFRAQQQALHLGEEPLSYEAFRRQGKERGKRGKGKAKAKDKAKQTGHGPTPQPKLEKEEVVRDLDEADKVCPVCAKDLRHWSGGDDESERVTVVERKWVLQLVTTRKYRCTCGHIECAEPDHSLVKGGRYTPEVAEAVAVAKYLDHLPLERQAKQAARLGLDVTSQTLWDQVWALHLALSPVAERIKNRLLEENAIGVDETYLRHMKKGKSTHNAIWQMVGRGGAYFAYRKTKGADALRDLIGEYSGVVVSDGAGAYQAFAKAPDSKFQHAGCWAHAVRKAQDALKETVRAADLLHLLGLLYDADDEARKAGDDDVFRERRRTLVAEHVDAIFDWIKNERTIKGGKLEETCKYIATREEELTLFTKDIDIPLDNNRVERGYVPIAIGRRNYRGITSPRGGEVLATFNTIFTSAKMAGHDPAAYLHHATQAVLDNQTPELPADWDGEGH